MTRFHQDAKILHIVGSASFADAVPVIARYRPTRVEPLEAYAIDAHARDVVQAWLASNWDRIENGSFLDVSWIVGLCGAPQPRRPAPPAGFEPITLERLFALGWFAFVVDGARPGINAFGGYCYFLTRSGCRCLIGLGIPSGHPGQRLNGVSQLAETYPELFGVDVVDVATLDAIANAANVLHDIPATEDAEPWGRPKLEPIYRRYAAAHGFAIPTERPRATPDMEPQR